MTDCSPHNPSNPGPSDSVLRELLPEFFTAWDRDLCNAISEIVDAGNVDALHRLGHTIKGSMIQFGFPGLAAIGISIMQDAERGTIVAAAERITSLRQQLLHLRDAFL